MNVWELIIQQPVTNFLIVLSHYLGGSFGLSVIVLTIIVNLLMFPLTMSQLRSTKAMQSLQPRLQEIQQKYSKDRQKLAEEQMKLYKESGVKPAGCAITMLIQMPVWFAVYQAVMLVMAAAPEALLNLSRFLYDWPVVYAALPLNQNFLWMNLAEPDIFLAILVGATMWLQQKMSTVPSGDPKQQQQTQMMLWMMPLMFVLLSMSFPSGLALYWVANSIVRIVIQYRVTGWGNLTGHTAARREPEKDARGRKRLDFGAKDEKTSADIIEGQVGAPGRKWYQPLLDVFRRRK